MKNIMLSFVDDAAILTEMIEPDATHENGAVHVHTRHLHPSETRKDFVDHLCWSIIQCRKQWPDFTIQADSTDPLACSVMEEVNNLL